MPKGFASIYIVLFVLILAIAGFFYLKRAAGQTPIQPLLTATRPTVANKTYSDELGFSFVYPPGYSLVTDDEKSYSQRGRSDFRVNFFQTWGYQPPTFTKALVLKKDSDMNTSYDTSSFSLWISENPDNLDPQKWYKNYWYYPYLWGEYEPRKSQEGPDQVASISGQPANFRIADYQPNAPKYVYLSEKGKMFLFRIISQNGDTTGETILSSFRIN